MTATLTAPTTTVSLQTTAPNWETWITTVAQQRWDATERLLDASWMQSVPASVRESLAREFSNLSSEFGSEAQLPGQFQAFTQKVTRLALPSTPYEWTLWLTDIYPQSAKTPWLEWTGEGKSTTDAAFSLSILDVDSPQWWFTSLIPIIQSQLGTNTSPLCELATLVRLLGPAVAPYWLARQHWLGALESNTAAQASPLVQEAAQRWGWDSITLATLPFPTSGTKDTSSITAALEKAEAVVPSENAFHWETNEVAAKVVPDLQQGWLISARDVYAQPAPTSSPLKERLISSSQQPNSPHAIVYAGWLTLLSTLPPSTERTESLVVKSIETTAIHKLLHVAL